MHDVVQFYLRFDFFCPFLIILSKVLRADWHRSVLMACNAPFSRIDDIFSLQRRSIKNRFFFFFYFTLIHNVIKLSFESLISSFAYVAI